MTVRKSPNPTPSIPSKAVNIFERDRKAEEALSPRYDNLNQLLTAVEQTIKALKPPHNVWVSYNEVCYDESHNLRSWQVLGIAKYLNKWRLCHGQDDDENHGGVPDAKPLVECPQHVRVEAAKYARKLYEEVIKKKEEYVPKVDDAIMELRDFLQDVNP